MLASIDKRLKEVEEQLSKRNFEEDGVLQEAETQIEKGNYDSALKKLERVMYAKMSEKIALIQKVRFSVH